MTPGGGNLKAKAASLPEFGLRTLLAMPHSQVFMTQLAVGPPR